MSGVEPRASWRRAALAAAVLLLSCLFLALTAPARAASTRTEAALQAALDNFVAQRPNVPGAALHVKAPTARIDWGGASGLFRFDSDRPLTTSDPFWISSVTKTFTAAAVLRLVERHRLRLDDRAARYLPRAIIDRVQATPADGRRITIRELLNHTSGVYDYATDAKWQAQVAIEPERTWHPPELIEVAIHYGQPYFPPGKGYHYSDTGYVMLGLIVERIAGQRLAVATRRLLGLGRLGLESTWTELHEPPPRTGLERAHQYFAACDLTHYNPSFDDFGGGGLVSTGDDLSDFVRDLFGNRVFQKRRTLDAMLSASAASKEAGVPYGLGIYRLEIAGETVWGHEGFFGAFMYYVPRLDLSIGGSDDQALESSTPLAEDVIEIVRAAESGRPLPAASRRRELNPGLPLPTGLVPPGVPCVSP